MSPGQCGTPVSRVTSPTAVCGQHRPFFDREGCFVPSARPPGRRVTKAGTQAVSAGAVGPTISAIADQTTSAATSASRPNGTEAAANTRTSSCTGRMPRVAIGTPPLWTAPLSTTPGLKAGHGDERQWSRSRRTPCTGAWTEDGPFLCLAGRGRRVLYTTNAIKALNAKLHRGGRARRHSPSGALAMTLVLLRAMGRTRSLSPSMRAVRRGYPAAEPAASGRARSANARRRRASGRAARDRGSTSRWIFLGRAATDRESPQGRREGRPQGCRAALAPIPPDGDAVPGSRSSDRGHVDAGASGRYIAIRCGVSPSTARRLQRSRATARAAKIRLDGDRPPPSAPASAKARSPGSSKRPWTHAP